MTGANQSDRLPVGGRNLMAAAALTGFAAVALGAFAAHGLADRLDEEALAWWETGADYLLFHAIAALACSGAHMPPRGRAAGWGFLGGGALFAGALFSLALGAPRGVAILTPLGGLILLASWLWIALTAMRR